MPYLTNENNRGDNYQFLTKSLFEEWSWDKGEKYPPVFTLKDYDHRGCRSLYQEYMLYESEYEAAIGIFGSWHHWEVLKACSWFKPYLEAWEAERSLKDKARAKRQLVEQAENGNVTAQRILYGAPPEESRKRKTKAEKAKDEADSADMKKLEELYKESPLAKAH